MQQTIQQLKEALQHNIILTDGAMGTYFNRLHPEDGEAEFANTEHPEWIVDIHKKYVEAGAQLIRTNTFAVNHMLFPKEQIADVLTAAVRNAYEAVGEQDIYIAGSIGPIRYSTEKEELEVCEEYQHICDVLLAQGIRIFILETFSEASMVLKIAEYLKAQEEAVFVLAQFSVNRMGYTKFGYSMQKLVNEMYGSGIDGIGFNCGISAAHMNQLLGKITFSGNTVLSALPNAGYDHALRGRQLLLDNPDYYAGEMEELLKKGVNLVGGCCGTTPEYIAAIKKRLPLKPSEKRIVREEEIQQTAGKSNPFIDKLNGGQRVYVVEIDAPFNENGDKFLQAAYQLKENDVDLVTISDSPMARTRADAFQMGIYIAGQTGLRVMPHVCCRDRNVIALRSAILGGYINGIRDMLVITGDPVARDDRNIVTGVFDFNSIKLMEYIRNMNEENFSNEPFYYGGALNYAGINAGAIANRMKKKMEAGCSYFLTQPVYSDADIARVRELKEMTGAKIILGIMPLVSYKNAIFMKNEMPGIDVPSQIVDRYAPDMSRSEAEMVAEEISVEIAKKGMDYADGFYLMTPFNRVALVNRIICRLREEDVS